MDAHSTPNYYGRDPSTEAEFVRAYYDFKGHQDNETKMQRTDYQHTRGVVTRYDNMGPEYYTRGPAFDGAPARKPRFVPRDWVVHDRLVRDERK